MTIDPLAARLATDLVVTTRRFIASLPAFARAMVNDQALDRLALGVAEALVPVVRQTVADAAAGERAEQ